MRMVWNKPDEVLARTHPAKDSEKLSFVLFLDFFGMHVFRAGTIKL